MTLMTKAGAETLRIAPDAIEGSGQAALHSAR
jgi:hypothetical protein